jgi:hypothetical protein
VRAKAICREAEPNLIQVDEKRRKTQIKMAEVILKLSFLCRRYGDLIFGVRSVLKGIFFLIISEKREEEKIKKLLSSKL